MYSIYKITLARNGKIYVGMTGNLSRRMAAHRARNFRGKEFDYEVLCKAKTIERAETMEAFWIRKLRAHNRKIGLNLSVGRDICETTRQKMSRSQKARSQREPNPFLGKKHTKETRARMSALKKGIAPACVGSNARRVKNLDTGEIFEQMVDACEAYGLHKASVSRVCRGVQARSGGYRWSFAD